MFDPILISPGVAGILLFAGTVNAAGGLGAIDAIRAAAPTEGLFRWDAAMPFPVLIGIVVARWLSAEQRVAERREALEAAGAPA